MLLHSVLVDLGGHISVWRFVNRRRQDQTSHTMLDCSIKINKWVATFTIFHEGFSKSAIHEYVLKTVAFIIAERDFEVVRATVRGCDPTERSCRHLMSRNLGASFSDRYETAERETLAK